jgi:hypothetical protein
LTIFYISTERRVMTLRVNRERAGQIAFDPTGSPDRVGSRQLTVTLAAGANTLQLDNVNGSFGAEIDRVTLTR